MRIAVDSRLLQGDELNENFTQEFFCRLAENQPGHQFIFLFDKPTDTLPALPENVTTVVVTPKPGNIIQYKWWYDVKLPLALKKHKADLFIGTYGLCSLTTTVPQLLIVQNLAFNHSRISFTNNNFFYKKFIGRFLRKATFTATISDCVKNEIVTVYKIPGEKMITIAGGASHIFKPLNWHEKEKVKEQYAGGSEYFLFTAGADAKKVTSLLKAFSVFKKWQKTNMKLILAGNIDKYKNVSGKLNSYKYKNDIIHTGNLSASELANVTAGAYAIFFPSLHTGFRMEVLEAMQCEVPVITSANSGTAEIAADAALYADPDDYNEIAEQMKRIFKDELLRNKLIAAGKERATIYTADNAIALIWQAIGKSVSR